jgi:hypothetical protein
VTCPAKYKVLTKHFNEKSEGLDKSKQLTRKFVKLVKIDAKVVNPWEKQAQIGADGTLNI